MMGIISIVFLCIFTTFITLPLRPRQIETFSDLVEKKFQMIGSPQVFDYFVRLDHVSALTVPLLLRCYSFHRNNISNVYCRSRWIMSIKITM